MCNCNFSLLISREVNFKSNFQFHDCDCLPAEHQVFALFCKKCQYSAVCFLRNYFASRKCYCLGMEKDEFCRDCRQLRHALNFFLRKVCVESKEVPAEFKLQAIDKYLMRRLNASPMFFY